MGMLFEYAAPIGYAEDEFSSLHNIEARRDEELAEARATQIINELEDLVKDIRGQDGASTPHEIAVRLYHFMHNGCK
jgi:hypothetical protein